MFKPKIQNQQALNLTKFNTSELIQKQNSKSKWLSIQNLNPEK